MLIVIFQCSLLCDVFVRSSCAWVGFVRTVLWLVRESHAVSGSDQRSVIRVIVRLCSALAPIQKHTFVRLESVHKTLIVHAFC